MSTYQTQHRPMQPGVVPVGGGRPAQDLTPFLDSLDAIKHQYDALRSEVVHARTERDEALNKLEAQISEVNAMKRALYDLETQTTKLQHQYQDEINRIRADPSSRSRPSIGIPGHIPRSAFFLDSSPRFPSRPSSGQLQSHNTPRTPPRSRPIDRDRERDDSARALPTREKAKDDDSDHLFDPRDPKRHKSSRRNTLSSHSESYPIPPMGPHPQGLPPNIKPLANYNSPNLASNSSNSLGLYRVPGSGSEGGVSLPSIQVSPSMRSHSHLHHPQTPLTTGSDELNFLNVPPEFKKEEADWSAICNPKVKKSLDINLMHTFTHATVVCCVQFSADGRYLATGCNRTAQIFDVQTGNIVCVVEDETASKVGDLYIRSVRFSPDGKLLATGAEDRRIRVWDIAKRKVRHAFDGHQQEIYSLDFSRDGRHIVSGSGDRTMRIWNVTDNSSRTITITDVDALNSDSGITSVAISPDGLLVAAGSLDNIVRIWDVESGTLLERLRGHEDSVYSVAFTPDGRAIVSGSLDRTLKYWDITSLVQAFSRAKDAAAALALLAERAGPIVPTKNFVGHRDFVLSASVSSDNRWLISGSKDRSVHFWDTRTALMHVMLQGHKNSVISLDINPLGGMLATGSGDNTARIWTYATLPL